MGEIFSQLSDKDKNFIRNYVKYYGSCDDHEINTCNMRPLDEVLYCWEHNKQQYLFQMLGKQLRLEREIAYEKDNCTLREELGQSMSYGEMKDFVSLLECSVARWTHEGTIIRYCFDRNNLINNIYDNGPEGEFQTKHMEHPVVIKHGIKLMKLLGRIAKEMHAEAQFEKFRIEHSRILNQKSLTGTLCLSIHPIDYITMSDNGHGWTSCMSWIETGCYRSGTVEMMNSPSVIVAYLKSNKSVTFNSECQLSYDKKWRELIIADPSAIINVKGYPYNSAGLSKAAIEWVRELAMMNLGWQCSERTVEYHEDEVIAVNNIAYRFNFETDAMYNDFFSGNTQHFLIPIPDITAAYRFGDFDNRCINYSGPLTCMSCGEEIDYHSDDTDIVLCDGCENYACCACCGDRITSDEYWFEDERYCEYCYNDNFVYDDLEHETIRKDDSVTIYLTRYTNDLEPERKWLLRAITTRCDNIDFFEDNYLRKGAIVKFDAHNYMRYVNITDCRPRGLDAFGFYRRWHRESLEEQWQEVFRFAEGHPRFNDEFRKEILTILKK